MKIGVTVSEIERLIENVSGAGKYGKKCLGVVILGVGHCSAVSRRHSKFQHTKKVETRMFL